MYKHITQSERYYIWQRIAALDIASKIAKDLKVDRSTIYREIKRNKNSHGVYISGAAQLKSELRRVENGRKRAFKKLTPAATKYMSDALTDGWSPEQISGRLKLDLKVEISHDTIYRYIWRDKFHAGVLYKLLPHQGKKYKYGNPDKTRIRNRVGIEKRPKIVERKVRIGDFEGDTIVGVRGGGKNCLLTLVDRKSKFTLIAKTLDKSAQAIQDSIVKVYSNTITPFKTITFDNGKEFCYHEKIAEELSCDIYFARPYKSCDRGLNEHTNGLIRRFLPKKTDFSKITEDEVMRIQDLLNDHPRKILGYLTPNEVMAKHLNRIYPNRHKPVALRV